MTLLAVLSRLRTDNQAALGATLTMELTIEKRIQTSIDDIRTKAKHEADEANRLRVLEKDQTIESMTRTIEELRRQSRAGVAAVAGRSARTGA